MMEKVWKDCFTIQMDYMSKYIEHPMSKKYNIRQSGQLYLTSIQ